MGSNIKGSLSSYPSSSLEEIDIRKLLIQFYHIWPFIIICIGIGLSAAFFTNYFSSNIYQVDSIIQFKDQPNPFSELNSAISLSSKKNSEKTESSIQILKSYTHIKQIIQKLNLELAYFNTKNFKTTENYQNTPFKIIWDSTHAQLINEKIYITLNHDGSVLVSVEPKGDNISLYNYEIGRKYSEPNLEKSFSQIVQYNQWITHTFFKFKVIKKPYSPSQISILKPKTLSTKKGENYITFSSYEKLVTQLQNNLSIEQLTEQAAIIKLRLKGYNKTKLVDMVNTSIEVLKQEELNEKNIMARNTISFIEKELQIVHDTLQFLQHKLETAQRDNKLIDLSSQANFIYEKYANIDEKQFESKAKLDYLHFLQENINLKNQRIDRMMLPSVVGIDDPNLIHGVEQLIALQMEKNQLQNDLKPSNPILLNLDHQIESNSQLLSKNLYHLIKVLEIQNQNLSAHKQKLESEFATLPGAEQSVLNIKRKHNVIDAQYTFLMEKRSEAGIVMAANTPDIRIVDVARDSGQGPISPNKKFNYLVGILFGFTLPLGFVLLKEFFKFKVESIQDVTAVLNVPIIGIIGHVENLTISDLQYDPSSIISESYRSLRTNCDANINSSRQKILPETTNTHGKVILITSLVQGEGKSLNTLNLGLSYAKGGHKTIIVAADLRKQTMHKRMNLDNKIGLSDFLRNRKQMHEVIQTTESKHLDFIGSGPKTKNPGELILSPKINELINYLRTEYEFVIIDTPPIGLVADAKHIMPYCDLNLHVVRQNYTKLQLMSSLNSLYESNELQNYHVLLNDVKFNKRNQHEYGMAYAYGYAYGEEYGKEYNGNYIYN